MPLYTSTFYTVELIQPVCGLRPTTRTHGEGASYTNGVLIYTHGGLHTVQLLDDAEQIIASFDEDVHVLPATEEPLQIIPLTASISSGLSPPIQSSPVTIMGGDPYSRLPDLHVQAVQELTTGFESFDAATISIADNKLWFSPARLVISVADTDPDLLGDISAVRTIAVYDDVNMARRVVVSALQVSATQIKLTVSADPYFSVTRDVRFFVEFEDASTGVVRLSEPFTVIPRNEVSSICMVGGTFWVQGKRQSAFELSPLVLTFSLTGETWTDDTEMLKTEFANTFASLVSETLICADSSDYVYVPSDISNAIGLVDVIRRCSVSLTDPYTVMLVTTSAPQLAHAASLELSSAVVPSSLLRSGRANVAFDGQVLSPLTVYPNGGVIDSIRFSAVPSALGSGGSIGGAVHDVRYDRDVWESSEMVAYIHLTNDEWKLVDNLIESARNQFEALVRESLVALEDSSVWRDLMRGCTLHVENDAADPLHTLKVVLRDGVEVELTEEEIAEGVEAPFFFVLADFELWPDGDEVIHVQFVSPEASRFTLSGYPAQVSGSGVFVLYPIASKATVDVLEVPESSMIEQRSSGGVAINVILSDGNALLTTVSLEALTSEFTQHIQTALNDTSVYVDVSIVDALASLHNHLVLRIGTSSSLSFSGTRSVQFTLLGAYLRNRQMIVLPAIYVSSSSPSAYVQILVPSPSEPITIDRIRTEGFVASVRLVDDVWIQSNVNAGTVTFVARTWRSWWNHVVVPCLHRTAGGGSEEESVVIVSATAEDIGANSAYDLNLVDVSVDSIVDIYIDALATMKNGDISARGSFIVLSVSQREREQARALIECEQLQSSLSGTARALTEWKRAATARLVAGMTAGFEASLDALRILAVDTIPERVYRLRRAVEDAEGEDAEFPIEVLPVPTIAGKSLDEVLASLERVRTEFSTVAPLPNVQAGMAIQMSEAPLESASDENARMYHTSEPFKYMYLRHKGTGKETKLLAPGNNPFVVTLDTTLFDLVLR